MLIISASSAAQSVPQSVPQSAAQPETLFAEANRYFHEANDMRMQDSAHAAELYRKALVRYERLTGEGGVQNGMLYYNIGNTYYLLGDLGRAVLNYLRAERLTPRDSNLAHNLAYVRSRTADHIEQAEQGKIVSTLLFWHYDFTAALKFEIGAMLWAVFWLLLALRLVYRRAIPRGLLAGCALVGVLLFLSAAFTNRGRAGVITANEVIARKGDGLSYEPSFQQPLHAGTEFHVADQSGDWLLVELPNGARCWLPRESASLV